MDLSKLNLENVAKEPMVDGSRPEFIKPAYLVEIRCFWFLNCLHPNMRWRFKESNWVLFSHGAGVDNEGIGAEYCMARSTVFNVYQRLRLIVALQVWE